MLYFVGVYRVQRIAHYESGFTAKVMVGRHQELEGRFEDGVVDNFGCCIFSVACYVRQSPQCFTDFVGFARLENSVKCVENVPLQ